MNTRNIYGHRVFIMALALLEHNHKLLSLFCGTLKLFKQFLFVDMAVFGVPQLVPSVAMVTR